jgi:hypothetical protein
MLEHTGLNKLKNFGPIYVINMARSLERKAYIQEHFKKYGVSEYKFVDAVDGSKEDLSLMVNNLESLAISKNEAACSISHLKAISEWLQESDSEYAIIVEDDVSLETVDFWNFTWEDFLKSVNKKYDVLQLAIINNFTVNPRLHLREIMDWSASIYLIKRDFAEKLISKHYHGEKYTFSTNRFRAVSEGMIFGSGLCYSIPLFTYSLELESYLHQDHVVSIHTRSKAQTMNYWNNHSLFKLDLL